MKLVILSGLAALVFMGLVAWVILVPLGGRHNAVVDQHHESACHALGHDYHWWSDRSRCVLYVEVAK